MDSNINSYGCHTPAENAWESNPRKPSDMTKGSYTAEPEPNNRGNGSESRGTYAMCRDCVQTN